MFLDKKRMHSLCMRKAFIFIKVIFLLQSPRHVNLGAVLGVRQSWARDFFSAFLTLLSVLIKEGEKTTNCKLLCGRKKKGKQEENVSGWKKQFIRRFGVDPETLETT